MDKHQKVRAALASGDQLKAISIAAGFKRPNPVVAKAWAAHRNPSFYQQLGQNVEKMIEDAVKVVSQI
jgi:hypothetical protein